MINWNKLQSGDIAIITAIAQRYSDISERLERPIKDRQGLEMDISAAHLDIPLNLTALLNASEFDFVHDIAGIRSHINRATGKVENHFLPRYALVDKLADKATVELLLEEV